MPPPVLKDTLAVSPRRHSPKAHSPALTPSGALKSVQQVQVSCGVPGGARVVSPLHLAQNAVKWIHDDGLTSAV